MAISDQVEYSIKEAQDSLLDNLDKHVEELKEQG